MSSSTCCTGKNLERILPRFGVPALPEETMRELNLAWHRLDAWPEVPAAMARLKKKFLLAPLSNGNISLMVDLARRNKFPWDAILGADIARDFKPKPVVYLSACEALRSCAGAMHAGRRALERSCRRRGAWLTHRALRAAERARAGGKGERAPTVKVDVAGGDYERGGRQTRGVITPYKPAPAGRRSSPGCDRPSCSSSAGSWRARCPTSR